MRWLWIDKFTDFQPRTEATAIKAVTTAEEHLHDLTPGFPIYPHSLVIEGMAQAAGILVGEASGFVEKVILAKIGKASFHRLIRPGVLLNFHAVIDQLNDTGASITGKVTIDGQDVADIELMFSHIDQNMSGQRFPEHNFVFTDEMVRLLPDGVREKHFPL